MEVFNWVPTKVVLIAEFCPSRAALRTRQWAVAALSYTMLFGHLEYVIYSRMTRK
jgi:hypothetical protein